jgi:malonyl-CoA/methylmalonyl-CoA synthetase
LKPVITWGESTGVHSGPAPNSLWDLFSARRPADGGALLLVTSDGARYSYDDAWRWSSGLANGLAARDVARGDRIAIAVEKSPELVFLYLACLRSGIVFSPFNPVATPSEMSFLVDDLAPALVVTDAVLAELSELSKVRAGAASRAPDADCGPGEPAAILYTSGTTGRPKGAMLNHGNLATNAVALVEAWDFSPRDVLLHALPMFHAHGLFVAVNCVLGSGASMEYLPRYDAVAVAGALERCSVFMGVPTYYTRLLADPRFGASNWPSMRLFISGSAPLAPLTHKEFRERTGHSILERYGMTETLMLTSNPLRGERRPGTVGVPLAGVEIRIVDPATGAAPGPGMAGEIEVRSPGVFSGYWRNPEGAAAEVAATGLFHDGYFRTGDLGRLDDAGYLEIMGRSRDLVISGGMNVYPKEVELVLDAIEGIAETAVVGVPDPDLGEAVVAFVVASPGHRLDAAGVRTAARASLTGYKIPKQIEFVDALPRNAMGKVEKAALRALLQGPASPDLG